VSLRLRIRSTAVLSASVVVALTLGPVASLVSALLRGSSWEVALGAAVVWVWANVLLVATIGIARLWNRGY
jgi:hypothetical protein